jgi:Protein of unknown function (DUF629)
MNRPFPAV